MYSYMPYKTLHIPIEDKELYYRLLELKAKWQADDWPEFLRKVIAHDNKN